MRKPPGVTPRRSKESGQASPQLLAAALALREEFLVKFCTAAKAHGIKAHKEIGKTVLGVWEYEAREAVKAGMRPFQDDASVRCHRDAFTKQFDEWCETFPEILSGFALELCGLHHSIEWVRREMEIALPQVGEAHPQWVIIACDGEEGQPPWCAPGWLEGWPGDVALPTTALWERCSGDGAAKLLTAVRERVGNGLREAQRRALGHASIFIAREAEADRRGAAGDRPSGRDQPEKSEKLPPKEQDLSSYFDHANLTDAQREVMSLRWEHGLSVSSIAEHLHRHRSSVEETLLLAKRKMEAAMGSEQRAKKRAEKNPGFLD